MFYIPKQYYDEIIAHLKSEAPNEGCGLLAGYEGRVLKHYRASNAEHSPVLYSIDAKELLSFIRDMDDHGWDLLAIYHSHTHSQAYPSATDVKLAFYPDSVTLIASLQNPDNPVMRGFRIVDGVITEEVITLDPPSNI